MLAFHSFLVIILLLSDDFSLFFMVNREGYVMTLHSELPAKLRALGGNLHAEFMIG